jgi:rfaE bifunctional protein kinase chain/domain
MNGNLKALVLRLAGQRVLVVGDVILDEYVTGRATRMSREAPVPVLEFETRRHIPGGAANPAANIAALGGTAIQIGVIGDDGAADHLRAVMAQFHIDTRPLIVDSERPTTVKMRVMAQMGLRFPQQVARLDTLSRQPLADEIEAQIVAAVTTAADVDAILVSDYHIGMLTTGVVDALRTRGEQGTLLAADAQGAFNQYHGFGVVKCNADEAAAYLGRDLQTDADYAEAANELFGLLELTGAMVITRGGHGATVATADDAVQHCPAPTVTDVYDTVGAGDTAIAVITLAICAGATYAEAVMLANYASGLVVRRVGNYAPTPEELIQSLGTEKTG